jgi:signal transduction histidine kinase
MATFKARARALDMLGRQQIAGIPTAISELFKNAHDAYADRVEVDYYRSDRLFVLRDDGMGMTREDFENRWLTLGTESKLDLGGLLAPPPAHPSKPERPILGEKGIGRLAIAVIGPQLLVLTRPFRANPPSDLVAAFIHWGLFQCPGVNLDQIEIPIKVFPKGDLPSENDLREMIRSTQRTLRSLRPTIAPSDAERIAADLESFKIDPIALDGQLGNPSLRGTGHGTQFYIQPADPMMPVSIDDRRSDDTASPLMKLLVGFTNTMTPEHAAPAIQVYFRDHKTNDDAEELIGEQVFFTPAEFRNADHHFEGTFDAFGQFNGEVTVYAEPTSNYKVPWTPARGKRTECGPFKINVAYVQGVASESTIPPQDWVAIIRKLNRIGGLYIYKDNVRVLPYGSTDYDFLDIEKNRTKSAGYYYFSYRRMFGVIEIRQVTNPNLSEKAGREGFRENKAYLQFRDILMNFFAQVAADFFREGGSRTDRYLERKAELDRIERARRRQEKLVAARRSDFSDRLTKFFERVAAGQPALQASQLIQEAAKSLRTAVSIRDLDEAARAVIDAEVRATSKMDDLRREYRVPRPAGVGLNRQLRREWEAYNQDLDKIEREVFQPTATELNRVVSELTHDAKVAINTRVRLERGLDERISETLKRASAGKKDTQEALREVNERVTVVTREIVREVDSTVSELKTAFAKMDLTAMNEKGLVRVRTDLDGRLTEVAERNMDSLETIREELQSLHWTRDEDGRFVGMSAMNEALQEDVLALRERAEADLELTQLGMAVNVINHEFENSIKAVRTGLRRLKAWADVNGELDDVYRGLRMSFDHLDGYLTLFTPLQRRLYRKEIEISGGSIVKFLRDLFSVRLDRHSIALTADRSFTTKIVMGYPSTFYPVFVNLVDNAIFWLKDRPLPRTINLTTHEDCFQVSDNGPGVPARDREAIFDIGFTRKPGGQGLGLFISREILAKVGCEITLLTSEKGGATFRICPGKGLTRRGGK